MAKIVSDYSLQLSVNVWSDILSPKPVVLGLINAEQILTAAPQGKSVVTLNWALPTENEIVGGEELGVASGAAQQLETRFDPISVGSFSVYQMSAAVGGAGYGDSVLSAQAIQGSNKLSVSVVANFAANNWVRLVDGAKVEYAKIASISGNDLFLVDGLQDTYAVGATVKEVNTAALKVESSDYTISLATGLIQLLNTRFSAGSYVSIRYTTTLQDSHHVEIYRDYGNMAITDPTRANVLAHAGIVTVNNNVSKTATQYIDTLTATENGQVWTYYVFVMDDETTANASASDAVMVETLPGVPQNVSKEVGENRAKLSWDAVANDLVNGYNVFRCTGSWIDANAVKLNSALITTLNFEDSALNVTNRVAPGAVPYPVNGTVYVYKVETEDTATSWTTGVTNPQSGDVGNGIAGKNA